MLSPALFEEQYPSGIEAGTAMVEADGRDGMNVMSTRVFGAQLVDSWPDAPSDCLGALAENSFASDPPSTVNNFIVRMEDPWRVRPAGSRMMDKLDTLNNFPPEAWSDSKAEWRSDRAAATVDAEANLTAALASYPSCTVRDVVHPLPYAVLECSNADAEALWAAGEVDCLDLNTIPGAVDDSETGREVRNGHGMARFLPNNRVPNANTALTGYTDAVGFRAAVVEWAIPADLNHPGFTWDGSVSKLDPSEGCSKVGWNTRCSTGRASSMIHTGPNRPHAWATLSSVVGSVEDGQHTGHTTPFDPSNRAPHEDDSTLARSAGAKLFAIESTSAALAAVVGRSSDLDMDAMNWSGGYIPTGLPGDCAGQGVKETIIDEAVEGGMPFFKSAGNQDILGLAPNGFGCNFTRPASALGAFTLSASLGVGTGNVSRRLASSHSDPAGRRTSMDMSTAGDVDWSYSLTGGIVRYNASAGTSIAAPIMASAAMVYMDHYEALGSSYVRQPLVLYTRLLLFGNGVGESSVNDRLAGEPLIRVREGFDHSWGAGKLHLKPVFIPDGLGGEYRGSRAGEVCVSFFHGKNVVESDLPEVSAAGGGVTVVARFHNADFSDDGSLDEIDLRLVKVTSPGWMKVLSEDASGEEKLRVSGRVSPGDDVRVQLIGRDFDGAADDDCGTLERRVVFAYKWTP